jgi:hypothetical protein
VAAVPYPPPDAGLDVGRVRGSGEAPAWRR